MSEETNFENTTFETEILICEECNKEFEFTAGEKEFYAQKGFSNKPKRCKECRAARKQSAKAEKGELYESVCPQCGAIARVPFKPINGRAVLCSECYAKSKENKAD